MYNGGYRGVWSSVDGLGTFYMQLALGGENATFPLEVRVTCPDGLQPTADGLECACPAGYGCDPTGQTADAVCPPSINAPSNGAPWACQKCAAGKYKNEVASNVCTDCASGSYASGEGTHVCLPCQPGSYAGDPGAQTCDSCPARLHSSGGQDECTVCAEGYFDVRTSTDIPASGTSGAPIPPLPPLYLPPPFPLPPVRPKKSGGASWS